jgi:hypothetical protein
LLIQMASSWSSFISHPDRPRRHQAPSIRFKPEA